MVTRISGETVWGATIKYRTLPADAGVTAWASPLAVTLPLRISTEAASLTPFIFTPAISSPSTLFSTVRVRRDRA